MSNCYLKLINNNLFLINQLNNEILKQHEAFSEIIEFQEIKRACIIVRENPENYNYNRSNIYCLDDNLSVKWFSDVPFSDDTFPNPILFDKEINENSSSWGDYCTTNLNTLTCSSQKGFTVTIEYETGKIIKSEFTK